MPDVVQQQQLRVALAAKVEHVQTGRPLRQFVAVQSRIDAQEVRDEQAVGRLVRDYDDRLLRVHPNEPLHRRYSALQATLGLPAVTLFGSIVSGIVLYAVWRGDGFAFYEALARPSDAPRNARSSCPCRAGAERGLGFCSRSAVGTSP